MCAGVLIASLHLMCTTFPFTVIRYAVSMENVIHKNLHHTHRHTQCPIPGLPVPETRVGRGAGGGVP